MVLATVAVAVCGTTLMPAHGEPTAFPPSAITNQDKIDWLTAEAERAAQAVDAEAEKPSAEQREAVYQAVREHCVNLIRLMETIPGTSPRLKARVEDTMTKAGAGLERIANARLRIGMSTEAVRAIRGDPSRISQVATPSGARQQWHYGMTVLTFADDHLVEILLRLRSE